MGDRIISAKLKELSRDWANSSAGEKVEILDLSDPTKKCALLNDIYPARYSGAGGLLGKNHLQASLGQHDFGGRRKTVLGEIRAMQVKMELFITVRCLVR